jgi:hypothetical protein
LGLNEADTLKSSSILIYPKLSDVFVNKVDDMKPC